MLFLLSSLDFSLYFSPFHLSFARMGLPFTHYPGYQRLFLACDRRGASFCGPQVDTCSAEGRRHERRSFSLGSLFKTDLNRKPRMTSLWHPGYYSHIRMVTIFGVIRMGVQTTPDGFGAGTETTPDMASVNDFGMISVTERSCARRSLKWRVKSVKWSHHTE